jgi:hypothetical protein
MALTSPFVAEAICLVCSWITGAAYEFIHLTLDAATDEWHELCTFLLAWRTECRNLLDKKAKELVGHHILWLPVGRGVCHELVNKAPILRFYYANRLARRLVCANSDQLGLATLSKKHYGLL